jgi:hypothetical protein
LNFESRLACALAQSILYYIICGAWNDRWPHASALSQQQQHFIADKSISTSHQHAIKAKTQLFVFTSSLFIRANNRPVRISFAFTPHTKLIILIFALNMTLISFYALSKMS